MNPQLRPAAIVAVPLFIFALSSKGQVPPEQRTVLRTSRPEVFVVDKAQKYWAYYTLDAMALKLNKVLLHCKVLDTNRIPGHYDHEGEVVLPAGIDGMRRFAAAAGYEILERAPGVLVAAEKNDEVCDRPLMMFAQRFKELNGHAAISVPQDRLEWKLIQTSWVRNIDLSSVHSGTSIGTYYWPTKEGGGREFYVLQQNSVMASPMGETGRFLRKVTATRVGGEVEVEDTWRDQRDRPSGMYVSGAIGDLELDFNGDGVVDVVAFSDLFDNGGPIPPLRVISGKNGQEIGRLDGFEFLITEDATGSKHIRSMDAEGFREYRAQTPDGIVLVHEERAKTSMLPSLIEQRSLGPKAARAAQPEERVLDDFILPLRPAGLGPQPFAKVRRLKALGQDITLQSGEKHGLDRDAKVYADYRPKPKETEEGQRR
jgi:hypothetical protein